MEEEIDLRQYISVLIKHWYWIIGAAIVAAAAAFVISSFTPPTYTATALVAATQPRYLLEFDSRFRDIPSNDIRLLQGQYRTYSALATSDDLLQQVAEKTKWSLRELKSAGQVEEGSDPSLLMLTMESGNPDDVVNLVNTWAEVFVTTVNRLYGNEGEVEALQQQQVIIAESLAQADAALTAFQQENGFGFDNSRTNLTVFDHTIFDQFGLMGQRLQAKNNLLTEYEVQLTRFRQLQGEVESLLATTTPDTSPVLIAGLLSDMLNAGVIEDEKTLPYQVTLDSLDPETSLEALSQALQARTVAIETEMEGLRQEIAALQTELATKQEELTHLVRERTTKTEAYAVISLKVQEAQIDASSNSTDKVIEIASQAARPTTLSSSRRLLNTIVAGVIGAMAAVFVTFFWEWWRNDDTVQAKSSKPVKIAG